MTRIDFGGAILALLGGFIVSAGITGFILSAGGYQLPMMGMPRMAATGPVGVAVPGPAVAQAPKAAQTAPPATAAIDVKIVATDLKFTPPTLQAKAGQPGLKEGLLGSSSRARCACRSTTISHCNDPVNIARR